MEHINEYAYTLFDQSEVDTLIHDRDVSLMNNVIRCTRDIQLIIIRISVLLDIKIYSNQYIVVVITA